jgi:Caspase domain
MATGESVGARRALLVAAETYADPGLARLRAPIGDVEALASVLEDPTLGAFELRRLVNLPTEQIKREIEGFFDDARLNDLLLLYMSGHGVLSQTRRFYFATSSTELRWLRATAIEDSFISDVMQHSRARSIVLIVDCCHSGAFAKGLVPKSPPGVDVVPRFEGRGRVTLTASTELEYAFEEVESGATPSNLGASEPGSIFTRYLVEGIQTGSADADQDGKISIDELYDYVYARVREHSQYQTPGKGGSGYGDLIIAASARGASLPRELTEALKSSLASVRQAAVAELARMKDGAEPPMAAAIGNALADMLDDDSLRVREAAGEALRGTSDRDQHVAGDPTLRRGAQARGTRSSTERTSRLPRGLIAGGIGVLAAGIVAAVLLAGGGSSNSNSSSSTSPPVTPARGTTLGSDLSGTYLGSCFGGPPETCTVVQYALAGRPTVSSIDGVVTRWGVRGRGRIALQVVRFSGTGVAATAQSDFETLTTVGPQYFRTNLPIHKGEFVALLMCAGSQVTQSGTDGAVDLRWSSGLLIGQSRARSEGQPEGLEIGSAAVVKPARGSPTTPTARGAC